MLKVGIPRALLYYQYYPAWKTFFEELGAETVVSQPTNQAIFASGNERAVAETCLPVKIFFGHVVSLVDKCDYVFIPAIRSMGGKAYNCAKFLGLPDMTKALVPESPPILDPEIDLNKGQRHLFQVVYNDAGRYFTSDKGKVKKAVRKAWEANLAYRQRTSAEGLTYVEAIRGERHHCEDGAPNNLESFDSNPYQRLKIAVIGHPYVVYDDFVNHRLIFRLESLGARIFTPEKAPSETLDMCMARLVGNAHWSFESEIVGAGEYYLEAGVDGIISVAVFACGPDSMMLDMVRHAAGNRGTPFLQLSLDEHTSEGGLLTRLEAFVDMVRRKRICV